MRSRLYSYKRFSSAIAFLEALSRINITCNWKTEIDHATGEIQWLACRPSKADLVVNLLSNADATSWAVEIFTERDGDNRRAANKNFWKSNLTRDEAYQHLTQVFQELQ